MSTTEDVTALLQQSMKLQAQALAMLGTAPPEELPLITTREALDAALGGTAEIIKLSTTLVYNAPLRITRPVTLISETFESRQQLMMTRDEPAPRFPLGIRWDAEHVGFLGLDASVPPDTTTEILQGFGNFPSIQRLRAIGDPKTGAKRGIHFHCAKWVMQHCLIDEIKRVGQDTQAVYQQEMPAPYGGLIEDCELWAAGQSMMIGGGDPPDEAHIPRNITVRRTKALKHDEWYAEGWQIKCAIEFKDVLGFEWTDGEMQGAGTSQGQGAYLIVATPRNQDGRAPFSTVQNVLIERVKGRQASGVCSMIGYDPTPNKPSGPLANLTIRNSTFTEIDPKGITKMRELRGSGRLFYLGHGPDKVTLEAITVEGQNISALLYCEQEPPTTMILRNWKMPPSVYGFFSPKGTTIGKLKEYAPDAIIELSSSDTGATVA